MAKRSEKDIRDEEVDDLRWVMSGPKGRRVMWRMLGWTGMYHSVFREAGPQVRPEERLVHNAALRDLGQRLMNELTSCTPVDFDKMQLEYRMVKALERGPQVPAAQKNEESE